MFHSTSSTHVILAHFLLPKFFPLPSMCLALWLHPSLRSSRSCLLSCIQLDLSTLTHLQLDCAMGHYHLFPITPLIQYESCVNPIEFERHLAIFRDDPPLMLIVVSTLSISIQHHFYTIISYITFLLSHTCFLFSSTIFPFLVYRTPRRPVIPSTPSYNSSLSPASSPLVTRLPAVTSVKVRLLSS